MKSASNQTGRTEREVFLAALEKAEGAEREAFLGKVGADDPALRKAVEELLQNHKDDDFMQSPHSLGPEGAVSARTEGATVLVVGERPGDQIGPYKLLQRIGEGGVGIVFMAEQEVPVRRRVALKVLKPGMDSGSVIARFESERQALALMDHPNIARVLDAGSTAAGRPYFVMDLVRGTRITDYCDQNQLPTQERLDLFAQVCEAIQHAHQKGIIHRDIKPSNILVTLLDSKPVPKVIDFGIAKALDQKLTDKTVFTEFHAFIGTPAYISPEQAEMSSLDVDTRTDIYSLGVLLYEMLVGKTPFDAEELLASGLDGMRRTIREQEPPRPSTRVRTMLDAERTTTAQRQRLEPARLTSLLRGDLDWIILKALEKDRTRRYETANALAMDVRRYLGHEPVLARPPSTTYRVRKFVGRNKLATAAAAAVAAALAIGLGISTWQWAEKSEAYRRVALSEQVEIGLRKEANEARLVAEEQAVAARRRAYAADMNLVQQALSVNNLGRAQELLARYWPDEDGGGDAPLRNDLRGWEWRHLWQQCRSDALFTLCRGSNSVSTLTVSPDGHWVALGEYLEGGLSIWDLRTRQVIARFPAEDGGEPLLCSPAQPLLAFASVPPGEARGAQRAKSVVRLWDGDARRVVADLPLTGKCQAMAFSPDGAHLLTVAADLTATLWDVCQATRLSTVRLQAALSPAPLGLGVWAISSDLEWLGWPARGGQLRVFSLTSGQELWSAKAADESVVALAFSPDGSMLASSGGYVESSVRLWDVRRGQEFARLEGHRTYVRSLIFWPDGRSLASASGDQTVHLWDIADLSERLATVDLPNSMTDRNGLGRRPLRKPMTISQPKATLRGHLDEVWSLALCPDNRTLVTGSKDGTVCVWDTSTLARGHGPITLPAAVKVWAFSADGSSILALDHHGQLARWRGPGFQDRQPVVDFGTNTSKPVFSAGGSFVATTRRDGAIEVWNVNQGIAQQTIESPDGEEEPLAFLEETERLVTVQKATGRMREWDLATGKVITSWILDTGGARFAPAVSPDGRWAIRLDGEGGGLLRSLSTDQETELNFNVQPNDQVAFSPDGSLLAVVSWLGVSQVWSTEEARPIATLRGFLQGQHSVAFSPEGDRLAVGSNAREAVKLWDVANWQELLTLEGEGSLFYAVAFSPGGKALAASNGQGLLHIWQAPAFEEIHRFETPGRAF